ncbi:MAG: hypothetical protein AAFV53_42970, partial [Myxococcota bacterium]
GARRHRCLAPASYSSPTTTPARRPRAWDAPTTDAERWYARLDVYTDGWQWDAARARLRLWLAHPRLSDASRVSWLESYMTQAPGIDDVLHRRGVRWLVSVGACDAAKRQVARLDGPVEDVHSAEPALLLVLQQALRDCAP